MAALALAVALLAAACGDSPSAPGENEGEAPALITELPRSLTAQESDVLRASNRFGFALMEELVAETEGENLFFSPLSASMALGMTLNGADGETFDQMRSTLGFGDLDQAAINESYGTLMELLQELDPHVTFGIANSIWTKQGFPVREDFLQRVRTHFQAEVAEVDFADPATLARINGWVSERTNGTIDEILSSAPAGIVMFLLNAIYFQGDWRGAFDPTETTRRAFHRADGSTVQVHMMEREGELRHGGGPGFQIVELPYGGDAFVMDVVLPDDGTTPEELAAGLDDATWDEWTKTLATRPLLLEMPRFELEWEKTLNEPLKALGMVDAFTGSRADFSRLTPGGGPWIDRVFQKSFVKVDEKGTEAAAATGVVAVESAPGLAVLLRRPFLLAIRERLSGTVLFMGIVNDPTG